MLLLQIVATMQVFTEPYLLTGGAGPEGSTTTVVYLIYQYAFNFNNYGAAAALGLRAARWCWPSSPACTCGSAAAAKTRRSPPWQRTETRTRTLISPRPAQPAARARPSTGPLLALVVVVFTLVFLCPLYWMVTGGLKSTHEVIQTPPTLFPAPPAPGRATRRRGTTLDLARLLLNTLYYAFGALAFQLVFDVAAAYALSKLRPVLGNVVLGVMLATLMIPVDRAGRPAVPDRPRPAAAAPQPAQHARGRSGCPRSPTPSTSSCSSGSSTRSPTDLLDAAAIDGAGPLRTLWSDRAADVPADPRRGVDLRGGHRLEGLPLAAAGRAGPREAAPSTSASTPLSAGRHRRTCSSPPWPSRRVPTLVIFLIFQRNIMSGLTAGSLKG